MKNVTALNLRQLVKTHVSSTSTLNTDESKLYTRVGSGFAGHQVVHHRSEEFARGTATTNNLESYFSVFKKGMGQKTSAEMEGAKAEARLTRDATFVFKGRSIKPDEYVLVRMKVDEETAASDHQPILVEIAD